MKHVILTFCLIFIYIQFNLAQTLTHTPCYTVAANNGQPNILFEYDPTTNTWFQVGTTGTNFMGAIAIEPTSGIMYAVEGTEGTYGTNGAFGIIDRTTGNFEKIGVTGIGNGAYGLVNLNNTDGLTFDPFNQIMYATHRVQGEGEGTNDLLFQIDISTGAFVPNAMINKTTGLPADYTVIPEIFDGELDGGSYDVADIAFNAYTGELYALHKKEFGGLITMLDASTAEVQQVIIDIYQENVGGLTFNYAGELYATTGNNPETEQQNSLLYINLLASEIMHLNSIDVSGEHTGFESLDCGVFKNDLALEITLDDSTSLPAQPGDLVTSIITVHNQGDLEQVNISLVNYLPEGISLADINWTEQLNRKATSTIPGPLPSGNSVSIPITIKVDELYNGNVIINAAEITASFNPNITDDFGNLLPLPDKDSLPNDSNDETNVVDNEINGGGQNANEDEDDHDIVEINLNNGIANILNLTGNINGGMHQARQTIFSNGQLKPNSLAYFEAGNTIILNTGFSVETNTYFDAKINVFE